MPIYEYECQKCGHTLEALQKLSDKPLRECPECGRHQLRRLVSAPRFRLAGSGWYETDFKSDKERKRNIHEKGDKEPAPAAESKEAAPAKQEAKADSAAPEKSRTMVAKPATAAAGRRTKPAAKKTTAGRARKR
jgi:putative FmdB family regulatory protein